MWRRFGYFENINLEEKLLWLLFKQPFWGKWLLCSLTSGHTDGGLPLIYQCPLS